MGPRPTASLSSRRGFDALRARGSRGGSDLVRVRFLASEVAGAPVQIAYSIPRRTAGAVGRNRIRRRLRAAVRGLSGELAAGAYLITPDASCRTVNFTTLVDAVRAAVVSAGALEQVVA